MFAEILQLNKMYKTNEFTKIRARVLEAGAESEGKFHRDAYVVFIRDQVLTNPQKLGTNLVKISRDEVKEIQEGRDQH